MVHRLAACAFGLACTLVILVLVVADSRSADFDKDWLFEDLTCEELVVAYSGRMEILQQIVAAHNGCIAYSLSPADDGHGALHCALIKKDGEFVEGMANDIVAVFRAKKCGEE